MSVVRSRSVGNHAHLIALVGSTLMALASWWIGALPAGWHPGTGVRVAAAAVSGVGLALVSISWLVLGRAVLAGYRHVDLRRYIVCAALPFMGALPSGRDLWAYAAQGNVVSHRLDPYRVGPSAAPGAFAREVSARWMSSPSPYGPLWLRLSQLIDWVCGNHPLAAVLVLRLPAFLGLALCVWSLPRLAARLPGRVEVGLWLGAASPLAIVLGVGGGHNDLLMLGVAFAGLAVATSQRPGALGAGAALVALAVLIKSPAGIVLAFIVSIRLAARGSAVAPATVARRYVEAFAAAAVVLTAGSVAAGLGLGWTHQVATNARWVSWLSLPTGAVMLGRAFTGHTVVRGLDHTLASARTIGEVLAVLLVAGAWVGAVRGSAIGREHSLGLLVVALAAVAVLGPAVQPWYYLWPLALAGLVLTGRRTLVALAALDLAFALMITPSGKGWESDWRALPVLITASVACIAALHNARGTTAPARVEPVCS